MDENVDFFPFKFIIIIFLSVVLYFSYVACYRTHHYENTQVVGELVGFSGEIRDERCGKQACTNTYHYVTYRVPEGNVVLLAGLGNVYPQQAILYRN